MEWQPIETMPHKRCVDVWVKSYENESFGRRATDVCIVDGIWYGEKPPRGEFGEYASHWTPLPEAPNART